MFVDTTNAYSWQSVYISSIDNNDKKNIPDFTCFSIDNIKQVK